MQYKVLVVEDDEDTAAINAISLKELGFLVEVVNNGDLAIPKMKEWAPHVVILDLELPGQNGVQILQQMFLDPLLKNLIIIANTVHMDAKDDLGFAYYYHFQKIRHEEPVMINKMITDADQHIDLRLVIADMLGQKYGAIPRPLMEWMKRHYPDKKEWGVV
ncbi:MAG: response regulator [Elusimicrobia bacterium]|nr:response regulator [Candidatus Obscuribacterium magneticum]